MLRILTGVGLATILCKALAAGQQLLLARVLGASEAADAFFLAQVIPVLVAGLSFSALCSSTVYLFGRDRQKQAGADASQDHVGNDRDGLRCPRVSEEPGSSQVAAMLLQVAAIFCMLILGLSLAGEWAIRLIAPGSSMSLIREAARIQNLLLPVLLFQAVGGVLAGVLLARQRVLDPPLSMCLMYAAGLLGLWITTDAQAGRLSLSLSVGAALQASALFILLWRDGFWSNSPSRHVSLAKPARKGIQIRELAAQALPALGCNAISTLFLVTDRSFAAGLGPGQIAAISYVYSLITMPTQIIVNAVVGVCMPGWVGTGRNPGAFSESVTRALSLLSFALLPIAVVMTLGAEPLTRLALGSTRFTPAQIDSTGSLLALYCPAILGFAAKDALTAAAAAQGRSFAALCVGAGSLAVATAAKVVLAPHYGIAAVAHGTSLALAFSVVGLLSVLSISSEAFAAFWRHSKGALFSAMLAMVAGAIVGHFLPQAGWTVAAVALCAYTLAWLRLGGVTSGLQLMQGRP
jgi:putative peptidoglycan lipid II flippase